MRICSYIVKNDFGLAPNPFWGFCTLAVCTPNHQGIKLSPDDWIIGTQPRVLGNKLVYAMKIAEDRLHFDRYFKDQRFQSKKPVSAGSWESRCGDNIYFLGNDGKWQQIPTTLFHKTPCEIRKDTKNPYVYLARVYYYFGEEAIEIPSEFKELIRDRHGCKCDHDESLMVNFIKWLERNHKPGIHGCPRDRPSVNSDKLVCPDKCII
jgi:hypothetical protein